MRVDALGLLANKTVARIADKVVPCGRGYNTLHQSLLWSHTGRLYAALKMSPDEKSAERSTSHHHVWMSTEWQRVFLHFLQSALLVWQVSTQSQRALALCPWMWGQRSVHAGTLCPLICHVTSRHVTCPLELLDQSAKCSNYSLPVVIEPRC